MDTSIFITGATGNVGEAALRWLAQQKPQSGISISAGSRSGTPSAALAPLDGIHWLPFDFTQPDTFDAALDGVDYVFLLRPPQISDAEGVFGPLIRAMEQARVKGVVFLSVQGVERSSVIPHHKIEQLLEASELEYVFLRPSYFMQNLTTTLGENLRQRREIILPSARAKFNWVDVENIGEVAAHVLLDFPRFTGQKLEITGRENLDFPTVTHLLNEQLEHPITYRPVGPIRFWWIKRRRGVSNGMALVMLMLHFLPRFQAEPRISEVYTELTGKEPTRVRAFIEREKGYWLGEKNLSEE